MREAKWKIGGRTLDLSSRCLLMGVLNVTPDSFSDGGKFHDAERAITHGLLAIGHGDAAAARTHAEVARRLGYRLIDHRLELYAVPLDDKPRR